MKRLSVLFDGECSLCGRCRDWLARQPAFFELEFIPFQSPDARARFPGIEALHPEEQLLVVSDEGAVYRGPQAWIMCLYALREYRAWSQRLAHPALLSWARRTCELLSENRLQVSRLVAQASCLWGGRASCPAREVQLRPNSPRETPGGPTGRMPVPRLG